MNKPDEYDTLVCQMRLIERDTKFINSYNGRLRTVNDNNRIWQTKSIAPVGGDTYVITREGWLCEDMVRYRGAETYGLRPVYSYTGEVRFYDVHESGVWLEYVAWVVNGSVDMIYTEDGDRVL